VVITNFWGVAAGSGETAGRLTGRSRRLTAVKQDVILRLYSDDGGAGPYQGLIWETSDEMGGHGEHT